jgi:uncharacterized protein (DUF1810 family)
MTLSRFLDAQAPLYATALAELQAGDKRTHCSLRRPEGTRLSHPLRTE